MHIYIKDEQGQIKEYSYEDLMRAFSAPQHYTSFVGFVINDNGTMNHYLLNKDSEKNELIASYIFKSPKGGYQVSSDQYRLNSEGKARYIRKSQPSGFALLPDRFTRGNFFFSKEEQDQLLENAQEECIAEIISYLDQTKESKTSDATRLLISSRDNMWGILDALRCLCQNNMHINLVYLFLKRIIFFINKAIPRLIVLAHSLMITQKITTVFRYSYMGIGGGIMSQKLRQSLKK